MNRPYLRALIRLTILLAFGLGGWYIENRRAHERSSLSGFFESQPTQVASRNGGRVASIKVKEGDSVSVGQLLIALEAKATEADTAAREALAEQARATANDVRSGPRPGEIRRQEQVIAEARANLDRLQNGSRPEEISAGKARFNQAQAQYRKALAGARPEEIAQARAAERMAQAKLAQAQRGLTPEEKAQFRARFDGAVAAEHLAAIELNRITGLVREGADSQQHLDQARTNSQTAQARTAELREALRRAEAGTPKEELEQAKQAYMQAKVALDLVQAGARKEDIESARQEMVAAQANLTLLTKGARTEDIRAAEAKESQAKSVLDELRSGSRKDQIAAARAGAHAAEAQVRSSQVSLREHLIHAPVGGIVERIMIAEGDLVQAGASVLRIANPDDIWMRIYVPEVNLAQVRAGTEASLLIDGVSSEVPAVVESVATRGEFTPANLQTPDERGKQVFAVRLRLRKADPTIKAGMFATVKRLGTRSW